MFQFTPFPDLPTARLNLRILKMEDEKEILFFRSDPGILEFIGPPKAKNIQDARDYILMINTGILENKWILWGMTIQGDDEKIIGTICLWNISIEKNSAEIGYTLHPDFQGKGLMQEAVESVIAYGFEIMKLDFIEANLHSKNAKSLRLLKRNNFVFEKKSDDFVVYILRKSIAKF